LRFWSVFISCFGPPENLLEVRNRSSSKLLREVVPLQLFAYFLALEHGVDADRSKNLAKAVVGK
jgi:glucosamine 6-phosphate synthetase-like amidotransferase/phosphosugar isomerase protein